MHGVVAFIDHTDIPGKNIAFGKKGQFDEVFCSGRVKYAGQPVGVIVTKTPDIALVAKEAVHITYKNRKTPIINIKDAFAR